MPVADPGFPEGVTPTSWGGGALTPDAVTFQNNLYVNAKESGPLNPGFASVSCYFSKYRPHSKFHMNFRLNKFKKNLGYNKLKFKFIVYSYFLKTVHENLLGRLVEVRELQLVMRKCRGIHSTTGIHFSTCYTRLSRLLSSSTTVYQKYESNPQINR